MIPLCVLTSIKPKERRYDLKTPILLFCITQGILLILRLIYLVYDVKPMITPIGFSNTLLRIEEIIIYCTSSIAAFVPIFAFIVDINTAYARINKFNTDLKYTATHDALTNLINRRSIGVQLDSAFEDFDKKGKVFSVIIGDIDDFKKINDTYGHNVGDVVLKGVADAMLHIVGSADYVCRWGGEEMLILTPVSAKRAAALADEIRTDIEEKIFIAEGLRVKATATFGVAQIESDMSIDDLIGKADGYLYQGKMKTKNCVVYS